MEVYPTKDGLVRSASVKPHKLPGSSITDREIDTPIHNLILIREAPQSNKPDPTHPETIAKQDSDSEPSHKCGSFAQ